MTDVPSLAIVSSLLETHRATLGLDQIDHVELANIGQGEANLNVLVTVNQTERFNLRIGLRGDESERTLQSEFDVLQLVPTGVAPQAFLLDLGRTYLPHPYVVLSYLDGEIKRQWDQADLRLHAATLARLHQRAFDQHGSPGNLSSAPFDFVHRFDVALDYWRTHHPYLLDLPIVQQLLPPIREYIAAVNHHFTSLRRFSIVHGDAHPLNILFRDSTVSYIDWEWASIGDPAQDVATVGWEIVTAWQMQLTGDQLADYLATYLALRPDNTLVQRRDAWMVYTMFFDQMYHRTQIAGDTTGRQSYTVQQIETYLVDRFLSTQ